MRGSGGPGVRADGRYSEVITQTPTEGNFYTVLLTPARYGAQSRVPGSQDSPPNLG